MLGQANITEKIILSLAEVGDLLDLPRSFHEWVYWDKHQYYKYRNRLQAQEKRERARIKQALWRLQKAEAVTFSKKENKYRLTPTGWLKFMNYYRKHSKEKSGPSGKGNYLIIFDIPEKHRRFRDLFRQCLVNQGCRLEQKSVFQTNDESVFEFAQRVLVNCDLEEYVKFVEVKKIF